MSEYLRRFALLVAFTVLALSSAGALGGAFFWARTSEGLHRYDAYKRSAAYEHRAHRQVDRRCIKLPPAQRSDCRDTINDAAREQQRREHEVESQEVSAAWDRAGAQATLIGASFTLIGLFLWAGDYELRRIESRSGRKTRISAKKKSTGKRKA
jgi:uncharacterized membrane protein